MAEGRRGWQAQRTERLLQEALVALIVERGYRAVTVQDVLDRADVGRTTFYSHFANKDALLFSVFAPMRQSLREELATLTPQRVARFGHGVGLLIPLFSHAARSRSLYRVLLASREVVLLMQELREALAGPMQAHLEQVIAVSGSHAAPVSLIVAGMVSATLGMLVWWFDNGMIQTPAEMDQIIGRPRAHAVAHLVAGGPHALPDLPPTLMGALRQGLRGNTFPHTAPEDVRSGWCCVATAPARSAPAGA